MAIAPGTPASARRLVQLSGPLIDGQGPRILNDWLKSNLDMIARQSVDIVQGELDVVLQHPTGFYRSKISAFRRTGGGRTSFDVVVHDSGVIYGPWLAGTGSRNAPVTRFKGYPHWRRSAQKIERMAGFATVGTLRQLTRKLGG